MVVSYPYQLPGIQYTLPVPAISRQAAPQGNAVIQAERQSEKPVGKLPVKIYIPRRPVSEMPGADSYFSSACDNAGNHPDSGGLNCARRRH